MLLPDPSYRAMTDERQMLEDDDDDKKRVNVWNPDDAPVKKRASKCQFDARRSRVRNVVRACDKWR